MTFPINHAFPKSPQLAQRNENFDKFLKSVADFEIENPQRYKHEFDSILKDLPPLN
ncbi:hypothetical protein [Helicobacter cynogastricus]|uniref:hypothetical protein n=1 Tax=Helicobacter cynogastricus TaxID=329937 RepID=UPI00131593C5|nr:hypothetical protein [Helicobacter cynogastricus]